jgi:hypothetical protein
MTRIQLYIHLGLLCLAEGWIVPGVPGPSGRSVALQGSRFDELVDMDAGTETPAAVDDRYYSVPPTQPQLLVNTKPRITLTRFLGNIVKEDPEVRNLLQCVPGRISKNVGSLLTSFSGPRYGIFAFVDPDGMQNNQ